MQNQSRLRVFAIDTLYYIAGSVLYSLGVYTFARNANFAPGGVSGIALMVNHFTGWPIGLITLLLNIPLILVCGRVIGLPFLLKSGWTMLLNTLIIDLVFPRLPSYSGNPLLAAIFTGILVGAGLALVYMRGSSTGGVDFISMTVKKLRPHFSMGQITIVIDAIVILCGGLVYKNVDAVLYGILASFASTIMMDNLLYGAGSSKMAIIITNHGAEIAEAISHEIDRGSTLLNATGTYTGERRDMLLCVCSKSEIFKVRNTARIIDPGSMIMISDASEVLGEGFEASALPGSEDPAKNAPPRNGPPGDG